MKLLKLFGIVAGLHAAALVLIFANPGCSATSRGPRPNSNNTALGSADTPVVSVPYIVADQSGDPASTQLNAFGGDAGLSGEGAVPLFVNEDAQPDAAAGRARPTRPRTAVSAPLNAPPEVGDVTPATTYTVVRGDSLWTIAKRNKVTVAELAAVNKMAQGAPLQVGRKLIIPGKSSSSSAATATTPAATTAAKSAPAAATATEPKASLVHVVRSGETLGGIARRYQVRVGDIALANNIADPAKIRLGQTLVIPGGRVSTTVAAPRPAQTPVAKAEPAAPTPPSAAQIESTPALSIEAPEIIAAPPIDSPLDDGFGAVPADAPVIDIEE
ncbi:hypothetical protein AXK12_07275 [Cephaloticoccus capnophilus]|uniref:LysM domain-containing protein n=1 Tax=Cephaloticoccus capnophilus TaxID=1548208 RepID=A0A139SJ72_9BACT|nr:LysM domain-containing protein [Cephaloticoccus capnophilus]KXU34544.1 hypothetical protein AXK12_07275 [Cephaloticoccus capnophilus]